jgi:hypothetical protein
VAELGDTLWVRGSKKDVDAEPVLSLLPAARFFDLIEPDRLRGHGRLVPTMRLPPTRFQPLRAFLSLRVPALALPAESSKAVELRLVPGRAPGQPSRLEELLLARIESFREFLSEAPSHRLSPLVFALNGRGEALIRGTPLPSIPGERFLSRDGIAVPAGWVWTPTVGYSVLRNWLGLAPSTLAVWRVDGTISEVSKSLFSPASRRVRHAL